MKKYLSQEKHHYQDFKIRRKQPVWLRYDQTYAYRMHQRTFLTLMALVQPPGNSRFRWRDWTSLFCRYQIDEERATEPEYMYKRATEPEYMYNEILPLILEKQKVFEAKERSI